VEEYKNIKDSEVNGTIDKLIYFLFHHECTLFVLEPGHILQEFIDYYYNYNLAVDVGQNS
jgi:hypothetical protein